MENSAHRFQNFLVFEPNISMLNKFDILTSDMDEINSILKKAQFEITKSNTIKDLILENRFSKIH